MPVNKDLLKRTLAAIEADPASWNQSWWRCETAMCFAGHAAILSGATWVYEYGKAPSLSHGIMVDTPEGECTDVDWYAECVLGLSSKQAERLFDEDNSIGQLRRIVAELCEEEP